MARTRRNLKTLFARRLRQLREDSGASQETFANKIGMARGYYGEIERGGQNVCLESIELIARGLGVEVRELFNFGSV